MDKIGYCLAMNWISIIIRETHSVFVVVCSICKESRTWCITPTITVSPSTSGDNSRVYTSSCAIKSSTRKAILLCIGCNNCSNRKSKTPPSTKTSCLPSCCWCIYSCGSTYILIFPNISTRSSILCPNRKCWFCILWSSSCSSWTRSWIGISRTLSESVSITDCCIGST